MRKLLCAAFAALFAVGSAEAIINGEPDGNRHPYVVGIGLIGADGQQNLCTGTLVSRWVVVTAGHCTYRVTRPAAVWNTSQLGGPPQSVGLAFTHPDFNPELTTPNTGDIGVIRLFIPIDLPTYGALPTAGYLDSFASKKGQQDRDVTIVGYGLQSVKPEVFTGERMMGHAQIRNVNNSTVRDYGLQTSNSRGNGGSGTCSGDSGGPILHGDSNLVLAVNSFGKNANCVGNDYSYRTDSPAARAFLDDFVAVP